VIPIFAYAHDARMLIQSEGKIGLAG